MDFNKSKSVGWRPERPPPIYYSALKLPSSRPHKNLHDTSLHGWMDAHGCLHQSSARLFVSV